MGKWIRRILMGLALFVFLFSAGMVIFIRHQYKIAEDVYNEAVELYVKPAQAAPTPAPATPEPEPEEPAEESEEPTEEPEPTPVHIPEYAPIEVDFDSIRSVNWDVIGWIYCEGTVINYPVAHGSDNEYYLHHTYEGTYSNSGTIMLETTNRSDFSDGNSIIYGHHMQSGRMFATLENWGDQSYYEEHPVMWLLTPEQDYKVVLFSGYYTSAYSADVYSVIRSPGEALTQYIYKAAYQSDFRADVTLDPNGRYVVLSTCAYVFDYARYVLHGMLVPVDSAGGVPIETQ